MGKGQYTCEINPRTKHSAHDPLCVSVTTYCLLVATLSLTLAFLSNQARNVEILSENRDLAPIKWTNI